MSLTSKIVLGCSLSGCAGVIWYVNHLKDKEQERMSKNVLKDLFEANENAKSNPPENVLTVQENKELYDEQLRIINKLKAKQ
ncbi:hypothetical protein SNEBB_003213 [Seison nebaliae]|nr:hypothetical protein SNEBB_003213 [Seison nebaliae]